MALTATLTTIPTCVKANQPFTVVAAVANDTTSTALASSALTFSSTGVSGRLSDVQGNPQKDTTLAGSATTYLTWTGVVFSTPGDYGGTVTIRLEVQGADASDAMATAKLTVYPVRMPPISLGPVLDFRLKEDSQNLPML